MTLPGTSMVAAGCAGSSSTACTTKSASYCPDTSENVMAEGRTSTSTESVSCWTVGVTTMSSLAKRAGAARASSMARSASDTRGPATAVGAEM